MSHIQKLPNIFLFVFSFLCTTNLFSQNWNIINRNYHYNFIKEGSDFIEPTIWVDSVKCFGVDTLYYLNRIVVDTDTSSYLFNGNYSPYSYYNYPQFLQSEIIKHDSCYEFNFPHRFFIYHKAKINQLWVFDSLTLIQAQVVSLLNETFLGVTDSIRVIEMSNKDTIILSKNYGIIRFDPVYEKSKYKLGGIESIIGETIPKFNDFFNFSIGDIFEYHGYYWQTDTETKFIIRKNLIVAKRVKMDTLEYDVKMLYHECPPGIPKNLWNSSKWSHSSISNQTWQFVNTPDHPTNLYNNQLFYLNGFFSKDNCDRNYSFSKVTVQKDQSNRYTKTLGSLKARDFFYISDTVNFIFSKFLGQCDEHEITYKEGLGEVYHEISGSEWNSYEELTGYKIGRDTTGNISNDEDLIVSVSELGRNKLIIYPNPAHDLINIQLDEDALNNCSVEIQGLNGQTLVATSNTNTINLNGLLNGIYFIKIKLNNKTIFRRFLKN
jgi:hypothetical protein